MRLLTQMLKAPHRYVTEVNLNHAKTTMRLRNCPIWADALFALYTVGAVIAAAFISRQQGGGQLPRESLLLFVPVFGYLAVRAHMTGEATLRFTDVSIQKNRTLFWMAVASFWFGFVAFLVAGIGALLGFWP